MAKLAKEVIAYLNKDFRVSRNIRVSWYLEHLMSQNPVHVDGLDSDCESGLQVLSVIPETTDESHPKDDHNGDQCIIGPKTDITFLSSGYRFVFALDLSCASLCADTFQQCVMAELLLTNLEECLMSLIQPFCIAGIARPFTPDIFVTVFAQWVYTCPSKEMQEMEHVYQRVIIQGCRLCEDSVVDILQRVKSVVYSTAYSVSPTEATSFRQKHDDMLLSLVKTGLLALKLLPSNTSSGIVVLTSGVIGEPESASLDKLLSKCQNATTTCSFVHVNPSSFPLCPFGCVPHCELMEFVAHSTKGTYINTFSVCCTSAGQMNFYQNCLLKWSFQAHAKTKSTTIDQLVEKQPFLSRTCSAFELRNLSMIHSESPTLLSRKHSDKLLRVPLLTIVSSRLREGYEISRVIAMKNSLEVHLVLSWWKNGTAVEYRVSSTWPSSKNACKIEVYLTGTYQFLLDVSKKNSNDRWTKSRKLVLHRFFLFLQDLQHADHMLQYLASFNADRVRYVVSDSVSQAQSLFFPQPDSSQFVPSKQGEHTSSSFSSYWKPVLSLDVDIWQRWLHIHQIHVILRNIEPLPKHLHALSPDGRYHTLQFQVPFSHLTTMLREWSTFVLLEGHTYVKFIYLEDGEKPSHFSLVRLSNKFPCVVIKLAFLIGVPGQIRKLYVHELRERVATLGLNNGGKRVRHSSSRISPQVRHHHTSDKRPSVFVIKKPVDQIVVRHQEVPRDFFHVGPSRDSQLNPMKTVRDHTGRIHDMAWYLKHKRYIWSLTSNTITPLSMKMAASLPTLLLKLRIAEGFCIAQSAPGVVNLVKEFPLSSMFHTPDQHASFNATHFECLVQCVVFPPKIRTSANSLSNNDSEEDDDDHDEMLKSPKEILLAMEVWTEPQHGYVCQTRNFSPFGSGSSYKQAVADGTQEVPYYEGLDYSQIGPAMVANDTNCISNVITLEHLQLMCSSDSVDNSFPQSPETFTTAIKPSPQDVFMNNETLNFDDGDEKSSNENVYLHHPTCAVQHVEVRSDVVFFPCVFDLPSLLDQSSKVKLLFMTLTQDSENENGPNCAFFSSYRHALEKLSDCEVSLSKHDHHCITKHIVKNNKSVEQSLAGSNSCAFLSSTASTYSSQWCCYLKQGDDGQIFVILLPATYKDFLSLFGATEDDADKVKDVSQENSASSSGATLVDQSSAELLHLVSPNLTKATAVFSAAETEDKLHEPGNYHRLGRRISFKRLASMNEDAARMPLTKIGEKLLHQRTLPIYVYNCSMQMLVSSALQNVHSPTRIKWQDSLQDHRFISQAAVDELSGQTYQVFSPTKDVFDTTKTFISAATEAGDRDDVFPLASNETAKLQKVCSDVVQAYYRSFVAGVFSGVQDHDHDQISTDDLQIATDIICHESVDELDITDFMLLHSPQVIEFRGQNYWHQAIGSFNQGVATDITVQSDDGAADVKQKMNRDVMSMSSESDEEVASYNNTETPANLELQSLDVGNDTQAVLEKSGDEKSEGEATSKVTISLHKESAFTTVRQRYRASECEKNSDSESSSSENAGSIDKHKRRVLSKPRERRITQTLPVKQLDSRKNNSVCLQSGWTNLPDFPLEILAKSQLRHLSGSNEQLEKHFNSVLKRYCRPISAVPDLYCCFTLNGSQTRSTHASGDVESDTDSVLFGHINNHTAQTESETPEKFANHAMSQKFPQQADDDDDDDDDFSDSSETSAEDSPLFLCMTCTVRDKKTGNHGTLPINGVPMDLGTVLNAFEHQCSSVDLSQLKITLDLIWLFLPSQKQMKGVKTDNNGDCDGCEMAAEVSELPPECKPCAEGVKKSIAWLLEDEIVSSLRTCEPISVDTLKRVTDHIEKNKARNCVMETVPLQFIFGIENSKSLFSDEFERLRLKRFKLKKEDDYYYLSLESSSFLPITYDDSKPTYEGTRQTTPIASETQTSESDESKKHGFFISPVHEPLHEVSENEVHQKVNARPGRRSCVSLYHRESDVSSDRILQKAASSTELYSGGNLSKRSNSISCMSSDAVIRQGKANKTGNSKDRPSPLHLSSDTQGAPVVLSPAAFHPPLQNSLSCGREPYSPLNLSKDSTASVPVTPVHFTSGENPPSFWFPSHRYGAEVAHRHSTTIARDLIASPMSDNSPRNLSQTSWLASGYEGEVSDTEDEDYYLQSIQDASSRLPSFWLVVSLNDDHANMYFHRRGSARVLKAATNEQTYVFREIHKNLLSACRAVNQTLLLKKLHESHLCHSLLVEEPPEEIWRKGDYSTIYQSGADEHGINDDVLDKTEYLAAMMNVPPGHFECDCVLQHHVILHHRIAGASSLAGMSNACPSAMTTVRSFLKNFAVINQKNMFVFQMEDQAVYYCRMQADSRKSEPSSRRTSLLPPGSSLEQVPLNLRESKESVHSFVDSEPRLHINWYGVHNPTAQHKSEMEKVKHSIERKLDEAVLEYITVMLTRNQMFKLTPADVTLIQPRIYTEEFHLVPRTPDQRFSFSVSSGAVNDKTLASFLFYLHQNLLQFVVVPRYTEPHNPAGHFLCYDTKPRSFSATSPSRIPGKVAATPSSIYLYIGSADKGRTGQGIGCIFLDVSCPKAFECSPNVMRSGDFKMLVENTIVKQLSTENNDDQVSEKHSTVVFHVWTTGSLKIDGLATKLLSTLRHTLCDLIIEHLLYSPLLKPSAVQKTEGMRKLFDSSTSEESNPTMFDIIQAKLGGVAAKVNEAVSKSITQPQQSVSAHDNELNGKYEQLLPDWLKQMLSLGCPSVSEKAFDFSSRSCLKQSMQNFQNIFTSCLPESKVVQFTKLDGNAWKLFSRSNTGSDIPGRYPKWLLISQNVLLWKKSTGAPVGNESLKHHITSLQKFHPHDVSIKPDTSPCPQHALITSSSYISRQHFVLALSAGKTVTVYLYNVVGDKTNTIYRQLTLCTKFHNARHNMLQGITFQKLGLFQHFVTKQKATNRSSNTINFSVDTLTKYSVMPDMEKTKQKISFVDRYFDDMYLEFQPVTPLVEHPESSKDKITLYGQQCSSMGKQKFRLSEERMHLTNLVTKYQQSSLSVCSVSSTTMSVLMSRARLVHSETSPILLSSAAREKFAAVLPQKKIRQRPRSGAKADKTEGKSSKGSFLDSYRKKSGDSLSKLVFGKDGADGSKTLRLAPTYDVNVLAETFYQLYADHWKGFVPLQVDSQRTEKTDVDFFAKKRLYRVLSGGIALIVGTFHPDCFDAKFYIVDLSLPSTDSAYLGKQKLPISFMNMCENVKKTVKTHPFTLDLQLHEVKRYLGGAHSVLPASSPIVDILQAMLEWYGAVFSTVSHHLLRSSVAIPCPDVSSHQLFSFIVDNSAQFNLKVVATATNAWEQQTRSVMCSTAPLSNQHAEDCCVSNHDGKNVCLVVSQAARSTDDALMLDYFVLFTQNPMQASPRSDKPTASDKYRRSRRFSDMPDINIVKSAVELHRQAMHLSSSLSGGSEAVEGHNASCFVHCEQRRTENFLAKIGATAEVECYRSQLWQRLTLTCSEKSYANALTAVEFDKLLQLMNVVTASRHDPKLIGLLSTRNRVRQVQSLQKRLIKRFARTASLFVASDGQRQCVCVLHPGNLHCMVTVHVDSAKKEVCVNTVEPLEQSKYSYSDVIPGALASLLQVVLNEVYVDFWASWW